MHRAQPPLLFLAIALSILFGIHYYLWARLVRDVALPTLTQRGLTGLFVALYLSIPFTFWLSRELVPDRGRLLLLGLWSWFGLMFLALVMVAASDLGRLGVGLARLLAGRAAFDPEKRLTLARMVAGSIAVLTPGVGGVAAYSALRCLSVVDIKVKLSRLPERLNGLSIVQLSDIHIGPTLRREFVERVVEMANSTQPDVLVITGDLVDGPVEKLASLVEPLRKLRARHGVYFVTGNHDYYSGADAWCEHLRSLGIRVLRNERVSIGSGEHSFDLAGIDDPEAHRPEGGGTSGLDRALAGRDPTRELVLLAHQPRAVYEAQEKGVGLQLSGHTHGGQIWPWRWFVLLQQPVIAGLVRLGETWVYVNSGTGFWGPPMRLGAPAEISRLILERG